ncbi:MAG: hypothetical protein NTX61_03600 [Bacteroidetes bacterium]|nr:hypothetical protein [Bacteroidota bacterium]
MKKETPKITHSFYESAPEMLLDKIAEVNAILNRQKAKTGETESFLFWARVADVMKFAWDYFNDLKWILRKNQILESENRWLRDWNIELSSKLQKYEIIRGLKIQGDYEETIKRVDEYLAKNDQQLNHLKETKPDE